MKRIVFLFFALAIASVLCFAQHPRAITWSFHRILNAATATQYSAGDNITDSNAIFIKFPNVVDNNAQGTHLISAYLAHDTVNVANGSFRLLLLKDTIGIAQIADNAAFTLLTANTAKVLGYVNFTLITEGVGSTTAHCLTAGLNIGIIPTKTTLYAVLIAEGNFTPKNYGTFTITIVVQD